MTENDLVGARDRAIMSNVMPYIQEEVAKMDRALENKMLTALNDGSLTAEMALNGWIEKLTLRRFLGKFDKSAQHGLTKAS